MSTTTTQRPDHREAGTAAAPEEGASSVEDSAHGLAGDVRSGAAWDDATNEVKPAALPESEAPSWEDKTMLTTAAAIAPAPIVLDSIADAMAARPLAATMAGPVARSAAQTPAPSGSGPIAAAARAYAPSAMSSDVPVDSYINSVIADRYRVISKIGEGGMGTVYLAEHIIIEKKVALKVLSEDFARKADLVQRFIQEAKAASRIGHENIVDITDFGETPSGSVFIAMEFLEGRDLAQHIRDAGAMPFDRCRTIVTQICRALGAAHAKGIIHRDMKPENVYLIEREGRKDFVKILDFGIAKVSSLDNEGGARLTRTGMIFGTPEYMSPEQARGDRPDHRVDIYAVGCILYEMLTGDVPFHADTFMGVLTKHMFETPESPSTRAPEKSVAADVEAVVMKALAKDRDKRFQSMKEMSTALAACGGMPADDGWGNEPSGVLELTNQRRTVDGVPAATPAATRAVPINRLDEVTPPKKSRALLYSGMAAGIGLLGLGGAFVLRSSIHVEAASPSTPAPRVDDAPPRPTPAPPAVVPPVAPAPALATIVTIGISSMPPGAEIFRGKTLLGTTPSSLSLPNDKRPIVLLLKRHDFRDRDIEITPDHDQSYAFDLQALRKTASHSALPKPPMQTAEAPEPAKPTPAPPKQNAGKLRDLKDPFGDDKGHH